MLFNSWEFVLFFPTILFLFFILPHRYRWALLLIASYIFYMAWKAEYILLLIFSTLIDYFCAIKMSKRGNKKERRPFLYLSLLSNLGILFSFKYFNFFATTTNQLSDWLTGNSVFPLLHLLLPMGISFYTFQTLSYSIDVYNGKIKAEKHIGIFALFVTFFPQLVAGPIERASHLLPQFRANHLFDYTRVKYGLQLMAWGFFKKLVIADRLAIVVNTVYNDPSNFSGLSIWIASIFFAFQIYCDFSAYSDIAIGAAQVMGYDLMKNFDRPYFSKSISEFWKRWHISLSTWFKDYVYIPLGGNKVIKWRWYYNLFITFLISGIWHGANWTFIVWGALHGFYLIIALLIAPASQKVYKKLNINKNNLFYKLINILITFLLVLVAWVFFRANTIEEAFLLIKNSFSSNIIIQFKDLIWTFKSVILNQNDITWQNYMKINNEYLDISVYDFTISILAIIAMEFIHFLQIKHSLRNTINNLHWVWRWFLYYLLLFAILFFGVFSESQFIYFQF